MTGTSPSLVDMGKSFGGDGFSRSKTRVNPKLVPVVNFPYQGLLVQTYIQCHGSCHISPHTLVMLEVSRRTFGWGTTSQRSFWAFLVEKKNIECSLPSANPQNTSRVNSFSLPNNAMTLMTMSVMVAIRPIWLLWLAKC